MKFYPPKGRASAHIALVSGHTAVVEQEGSEIDARFYREAIAMGCVPHGAADEDSADGDAGFDRSRHLLAVINEMVAAADPKEFDASGKPALRAVVRRAGFTVSSSERDAAWEAYAAQKDEEPLV